MVLGGFILARAGIVTQQECGAISRISVYIFVPCMLFGSFLTEWTQERIIGMGLATLGAALIHLLFILVTALVRRIRPMSEVDAASLIYTNAGNLLIPLIIGTIGSEYIIYSAAYMVVQNLLLWGYSAGRIGGCKGMQLRKVATNPAIISIFLGLLLMVVPITLPAPLVQTIQDVGACMAPVSMILVGILCASFNLRQAFGMPGVWRIVGLRLVLYPLLTLPVLMGLNRMVSHPNGWEILFVLLLAGAAPSAAQVTQVAQLYEQEPERASCINMLTTLLCAFTLPVDTLLSQLVLQ